jgi:hypothetical protein
MSRFAWIILLLSQLLLIAAAQGQPATTATSAPAAVPSDQSTPRGALKMLTIAMNQGDGDTMRAILNPTTPVEKRMVEALAAQRQAIHQLKEKSDAAFGQNGSLKIVGDMDETQAQSIASITEMSEQIEGDQAVIVDGADQLKFKKLNGKWVFPISSMPHVDFDDADGAIARMTQMAKIFNDVSSAIEAGKYKSPDEAAQDLKAKSWALAVNGTTSKPSSAPSSQPAAGG